MSFISANDAFVNPNSPWYYVVGSAFLVLIIAAFVIYNVISKKKRAADEEREKSSEKITDTAPPDAKPEADGQCPEHNESEHIEAQSEGDNGETADKDRDSSEEPISNDTTAETSFMGEEHCDKSESAPSQVQEAAAPTEEEHNTAEIEEKEAEKPVTEEKAEDLESTEKSEADGKAEKSVKADKPTNKPKAARSTAKNAQKPFIDRLIADTSVHGVYNELKNTILSYPGMKAKLGKDGETFVFGTDSKAELSLDSGTIVLKLAVDIDAVPPQFGATKSDGALPTILAVSESGIDAAQKLIMFAMNISMLTRNDRHRHVDYVQNAVNAKKRAKSKQTTAAKAKK